MALMRDVGVEGQALADFGFQVLGAAGFIGGVDGVGLVSRGLLWPKGGIWGYCNDPFTTTWANCGTTIVTGWSLPAPAPSTTWT
jgi:hypothetical protein